MDFSRKTGVVYSEVFLPPHAPPEYKDRELLWNAVEASEKQKNAQLARDIEFSLPVELQRKDQIAAAREMAEYFCRQGMAVDLNIHNPDRSVKNPHCHLMLTMRPFEEDGSFVKYKSRRVYDLDSSGNRIPNRDGTDFKSHKVNVTDWDNKENMEKWRAEWTKIAQSYLDRDHADVRMEHRSYEKQGLKLIPTVHIGPAVTAMERRGIRTEVGDLNRQIRAVNEETIMLEKRIAEIDGMLANLDAELLKQDEKSKLLQSAGFTSTEELFQAVKKTRQDHSALSVQRKELIEKMRGQTHLVDISEEYKKYAKVYREYAGLSGRKKEKYYQQHSSDIDTAAAYRESMKSYSGTDKYLPTTWKKELVEMKAKKGNMDRKIAEKTKTLEGYSKTLEALGMEKEAATAETSIRKKLSRFSSLSVKSGEKQREERDYPSIEDR